MGMRCMDKGERIPFIETREEKMISKINTFFDIAVHAMDRKRKVDNIV